MAAAKKGRKGTATSANPDSMPKYLALHATELTRALAAGALAPTLIGAGHVVLDFVGTQQLPAALAAAWRGRDYGVVALVEIRQERQEARAGEGTGALADPPYLPLAAISRIVFESKSDLDEFCARASGYEDVPVGIAKYDVDPTLFITEAAQQPLSFPDAAIPERGFSSETRTRLQYIDKLAGALGACLAATSSSRLGGAQATESFVEACNRAADSCYSPGAFIYALASKLDTGAEALVQARFARTVANALSEMTPSAGFDAERFLDSLEAIEGTGSDDGAFVAKFSDWARAVISGRHEIAVDGFTDHSGKTVSRAVLLFLLNPDPTRIRSMGKRLGDVGKVVEVLASTLGGYLSGFASLPSAFKAADMQRYLGVPLLARSIAVGAQPLLTIARSYSPDASTVHSLSLGKHVLLSVQSPPPPMISELRDTLATLGLEPVLELESGHLAWRDPSAAEVVFRARACETPVYPRRAAMELYATIDKVSSRERSTDLVAQAKEDGVFASTRKKGSKRLTELCVVCDSLGAAAVRDALQALSGAVSAAIGASLGSQPNEEMVG